MPSLNRRNKLVLHKFSCLGRHSCWQAVAWHKLMSGRVAVAHNRICRGARGKRMVEQEDKMTLLKISHIKISIENYFLQIESTKVIINGETRFFNFSDFFLQIPV